MFAELNVLTQTEAIALDRRLFDSERELKSMSAAISIRPRTAKNLAKLESNFGLISDVDALRDDLISILN